MERFYNIEKIDINTLLLNLKNLLTTTILYYNEFDDCHYMRGLFTGEIRIIPIEYINTEKQYIFIKDEDYGYKKHISLTDYLANMLSSLETIVYATILHINNVLSSNDIKVKQDSISYIIKSMFDYYGKCMCIMEWFSSDKMNWDFDIRENRERIFNEILNASRKIEYDIYYKLIGSLLSSDLLICAKQNCSNIASVEYLTLFDDFCVNVFNSCYCLECSKAFPPNKIAINRIIKCKEPPKCKKCKLDSDAVITTIYYNHHMDFCYQCAISRSKKFNIPLTAIYDDGQTKTSVIQEYCLLASYLRGEQTYLF